MAQMLRRIAGATPLKPPIEKLRKYGAVNFTAKKEDDPATI